MLNHEALAEHLWSAVANSIQWRMGLQYKITAIFVDGELADFQCLGSKDDSPLKPEELFRNVPLAFAERVNYSFQGDFYVALPVLVEDLLYTFYHILVEDTDRKVHRMLIEGKRNTGHGFVLTMLNNNDDEILCSSAKLFFTQIL